MIDGIPNRPLYFYEKDIVDGNNVISVTVVLSDSHGTWTSLEMKV